MQHDTLLSDLESTLSHIESQTVKKETLLTERAAKASNTLNEVALRLSKLGLTTNPYYTTSWTEDDLTIWTTLYFDVKTNKFMFVFDGHEPDYALGLSRLERIELEKIHLPQLLSNLSKNMEQEIKDL